MNTHKSLVGLLFLSAHVTVLSQTAVAQSCPTDGKHIADLQSEWILVGWEKKPGDPAFDFRNKLGKYYDFNSPDVVLYDDFEPGRRVARSAEAYGHFWKEPFTALRSARHSVIDGPDVLMGKELSTSTLEFAAALEAPDRKTVGIRTRSTLVWQCQGTEWKIVREHNSSTVIEVPEVERLLRSGKKADAQTNNQQHIYVGMWMTEDRRIRHELLPNGRYDEARGTRESAYQGRYEVKGNKINYWDDTGFTADGVFVDEDTLHHGGMVFYRQ